jgi:hypothetical protein
MINIIDIKRHGNTILLGSGWTATERGNSLPELNIRHNGKEKRFFRGSSLCFSRPLSDEDRVYLASIAGECGA